MPHRASAGYAPAGNALRAVVASEQGVAGRKGEERRKVGDVFAKPHLGPAAVIRKRRREAEERRVKMGAAQEKQSKILDESSVMEKRADVLEGIAKRKEEEGGKGGEKEDDEGSYIDLAFMKVKKCDSLVWQKIFKLHGSAITRMAKTKSFSRHKQLEAWMVEQDMACLSRMREQAKKRPSLKPVVWDDDEARPEEPPKDGDFDVVYWSHADLTWDETRDEGAMMERRQQLTVRGKVEAFAPLTKCALKRLRFVLCDSGNLYKQLSKVDGCVISGEDIRRLKPSCWLNDEIVNAYMALLSARSEGAAKSNGGVIANGMSVKVPKTRIMNSFFFSRLVEYNKREGRTKYDYSRVKRWTRRFDVFSYDMMLIPINQQNLHWTLGLVNFKDKTVEHLDSMGTGGSESVREHLMQWVRDEAADKKKDIELSKWKGRAIDVPMQENSDDCGVFLCKYADFLCRGWNRFTFSQRHMNYFRSRIAHELLMGSA